MALPPMPTVPPVAGLAVELPPVLNAPPVLVVPPAATLPPELAVPPELVAPPEPLGSPEVPSVEQALPSNVIIAVIT